MVVKTLDVFKILDVKFKARMLFKDHGCYVESLDVVI